MMANVPPVPVSVLLLANFRGGGPGAAISRYENDKRDTLSDDRYLFTQEGSSKW